MQCKLTRRLLVIELNEFDPEFLRAAAERLHLPAILQMLSFDHSVTSTDDATEHQGLDPWVQWVSIHTGTPTAVHGVRRLGATRDQGRQIWNVLGDAGLSWGVWGAMNAPMGETAGCRFFMPDPWSWQEQPAPQELAHLLALPRHVSKNYLKIDPRIAVMGALRMLRFYMRPGMGSVSLPFARELVAAVAQCGINVHTMTTMLDYASALTFAQLRRKRCPEFSVLFLNHIAHAQHHFLSDVDNLHPQMKLALLTCERIVHLLLGGCEAGEAVLVANAFRQRDVRGSGFVCYRQRDPAQALRLLGIAQGRIEQCMTNDAHVLFDSAQAADSAESTLRSCRLSHGERAFYVERTGPQGLFYQIDFDRTVPSGTSIVTPDRIVPFEKIFQFVTERTGAHVPEGDVFANGIDIPPRLRNHEMHAAILEYFNVAGYAQQTSSKEVVS